MLRWLYVDMNSYFASVEQEMHPELRGKPVAVVPMLTDTTCCIAASYEAKAFGVKTGTNVGQAKRMCPGIKLVEGDHEHYIRYHNRIIEAVESCLPVESICSIDEIACRLSGSQQELKNAEAVALKVKRAIQERVGSTLKCSIGIAPNRYLAKIAGDMQKPDGLTVLQQHELPHVLHKLKLRDLPGVGPRMEKHLNEKWIHTMEKLCSLSAQEMKRAWGSVVGEELWHLLRGADIVREESQQKSIGHSHVLPPDMRNEQGAMRVLKKLTNKCALRLRKIGFWATRMDVYIRFQGEEKSWGANGSWSASAKLMETQDTLLLMHTMMDLCREWPDGQVYMVGVTLSGLVANEDHVPTLFDDLRRERLMDVLDQVNEKYGRDAVHFGAVHEGEKLAPLRIAFNRIPGEDEIES